MICVLVGLVLALGVVTWMMGREPPPPLTPLVAVRHLLGAMAIMAVAVAGLRDPTCARFCRVVLVASPVLLAMVALEVWYEL